MSSNATTITGDEAIKLANEATLSATPSPQITEQEQVVSPPEPQQENIVQPEKVAPSEVVTKEEFAELSKTMNEIKASLMKEPEKQQTIQQTMSDSNQVIKEIKAASSNHFHDAVNAPSVKNFDDSVTPIDVMATVIMGGIDKTSNGAQETLAQFSQDPQFQMIQSYERAKGRDLIISTQSEYMSSEVLMPGLVSRFAAKSNDTFNIVYKSRSHVDIRAIEDIQTSISDQEYESSEQQVAQIPPAQLVAATFKTKLARFVSNQTVNNKQRQEAEVLEGMRVAAEKMDLSTIVSSVFDPELVGTSSPIQFLNGKYTARDYTLIKQSFIPIIAKPDKLYFNGIFKAVYRPLNMGDSGSLIPDEVAKNKHSTAVVGTRLYAPFTTDGVNAFDFNAIATDSDGQIAITFFKQLADFISQATMRSTMQKVGANPATQQFNLVLPSSILRMLRKITTQTGATGASIRKEFLSFDNLIQNLVGQTAIKYNIIDSELLDRPGFQIGDGDIFGVGYYTNSYLLPSYNLNDEMSLSVLESNNILSQYRNPRIIGSTAVGFRYADRQDGNDFAGKLVTGMFELKHGVNLPLQQFILVNGKEPTF